MGAPDDVSEADRLEQEMPPARDERVDGPIPAEAPAEDVLEQERPLLEDGGTAGVDADRTEPVSDDEWAPTSSDG